MGIIGDIISDYEKLIKTRIKIPLDNGDIIQFMFRPSDLPHLLGLQYLVDIPELFEYSQGRLSATNLYKGMNNGSYNIDEYEKSIYFEELYNNRIQYFKSEIVLSIISAENIIRFDPSKIKDFSTKMEKLEYMFWKVIKDDQNNYGYFGIGFMATGRNTDENYPNTFFFRTDKQYIFNQKIVTPMSIMIIDRYKKINFQIYWKKIRSSMKKNPHYKFLISIEELGNNEDFDEQIIEESDNDQIKQHYRLLKLDELNKAYLPFMESDFRWTNAEKDYLLEKISEKNTTLLPSEIKMLLNTYRQKNKK